MNGTTSRGLLILALACSSIAACRPESAPKSTSDTKSPAKAAEDAAPLSAHSVRKDGATHLTVEWKGQKSPAILVVEIYTPDEPVQHVEWQDAQELSGILLVRSIKEEGSATIEFADAPALAIFRTDTLGVMVYAANELTVNVYKNSRIKDMGKLQSTNAIRPKDCTTAFQVICWSNSSWTKAFRGVKAMEYEKPERGYMETLIDDWHIRDFVELEITLGDDKAQPNSTPN